jgi:hypothetical protein
MCLASNYRRQVLICENIIRIMYNTKGSDEIILTRAEQWQAL